MRGLHIFDIAVYRCTESKYNARMDESIARQIAPIRASTGVPRENVQQIYRYLEDHLREKYGGPWPLNQIIGCLRLYAEPSHVVGQLWWVHGKRFRSNTRKVFYQTTQNDILGTYFRPEDDSARIFSETLARIADLVKDGRFKGRYVDLEAFRNIGSFLNWRDLLNKAASMATEV
jgi:hypothetical protein